MQHTIHRALNAVAGGWTLLCATGLLVAYLVVNAENSSDGSLPPPPDYADDASWAALPSTSDGADIRPAWCGIDRQPHAAVDTFFVTPSSPLSYRRDNAPIDDFMTNLLGWSALVLRRSAHT